LYIYRQVLRRYASKCAGFDDKPRHLQSFNPRPPNPSKKTLNQPQNSISSPIPQQNPARIPAHEAVPVPHLHGADADAPPLQPRKRPTPTTPSSHGRKISLFDFGTRLGVVSEMKNEILEHFISFLSADAILHYVIAFHFIERPPTFETFCRRRP
jgi:hypothetical protein